MSPSPRDDLESLGYMLLYLITGSLPWIKDNFTKRDVLTIH